MLNMKYTNVENDNFQAKYNKMLTMKFYKDKTIFYIQRFILELCVSQGNYTKSNISIL